MFKSLLRTSPLYSGNVKIGCELRDYELVDKNVYECNIRSAKLLPISHQLAQKNVEAKLLGSTYDFDLKEFYSRYSDYFFESCFGFNKDDMSIIDYASSQYQRNTDFEYGVKRISYQKNGYQYAFFAPIYIDNVEDIPNNFIIKLEFVKGTTQKLTKTIKVNIGHNQKNPKNYIYNYLSKYAEKIDSKVAYISQDNDSIVYYGIDLIRGGFTKTTDNSLYHIFKIQTTINNFDASVSLGFKRNQLVMKQIIPLCFMFNIDDILTVGEKTRYKYADVYCSGYYLENKNYKVGDFYDFVFDYDNYNESIKIMDDMDGIIKIKKSQKNIQDMSFPCLNEKRIMDYQFSNKITPMFSRWKLKYSPDEYPYITNINYAFSKNQNSTYKYKEFPTNFSPLTGLCNLYTNSEGDNVFNLIFPLGENGLEYYKKYFPNKYSQDIEVDSRIWRELNRLFDDTSTNSLMYYIRKFATDKVTAESELEEEIKKFYINNLGLDEEITLKILLDSTYLSDLLYFYNYINNKKEEKNILKVSDKISQYIANRYIWPDNIKTSLNYNVRMPIKGDGVENNKFNQIEDNRSKYEIVYSHYNGKYFSNGDTNEAQSYLQKVRNDWPSNALFIGLYNYALNKVNAEVAAEDTNENLTTIRQYNSVRNNFSCDWFGVVSDIEENPTWYENLEWVDVVDNKCYYKGILYDLSQVYNMLGIGTYEKVDKFGVFIYPKFNPLTKEERENILYSDWSILRNKTTMITKNCNYNGDMLIDGIANNSYTYLYTNEDGARKYAHDLQYLKQYRKISEYDYDPKKIKYNTQLNAYYYNYGDVEQYLKKHNNLFLSLEDTNLDYYDVNKYYDIDDVEEILKQNFNDNVITNHLKNLISPPFDIDDARLCKNIILNSQSIKKGSNIESYELLPIHTSYMLVDKETYTKIYDGDGENLANKIALDQNNGTHIQDNDNCWELLKESLYISDREDKIIKCAYHEKEGEIDEYVSAGPIELAKAQYGVNFYRSGEFIRADKIEGLSSIKISNLQIEQYIINNSRGNDKYFDSITGELNRISENAKDLPIYKIKLGVEALKEYIGTKILTLLYDIDEYEFCPYLLDNNKKEYAKGIFTKRVPDTSRFYGNQMNLEDLEYDCDSLWIDTYNLYNVFNGIVDRNTQEQIIPKMSDFLCELVNQNSESEEDKGWIRQYYAKFSSILHLYHYYIELHKTSKKEEILNWETEWSKYIFVRSRKLVTENNSVYINKISIKDNYISLCDYVNSIESVEGSDLDLNNFFDFYGNNIIYDKDLDLYKIKWTKNNQPEYSDYIELVFKREFIRLNKEVWDILINFEHKNEYKYRDLYIYRLEEKSEYETKYKYSQTISYKNITLSQHPKNRIGIFTNTDQCLVPLFNDIFEQKEKETELYSDYVINTITETKIYKIEDDENVYVDSIYRYNKNTNNMVIELYQSDIYALLNVPLQNIINDKSLQKKYIKENHQLTTYKLDSNGNYLLDQDGNYVFETKEVRWICTPFELSTRKNFLNCLLTNYNSCNLDFYYGGEEDKFDDLGYIKKSQQNINLRNENINLRTLVVKEEYKEGNEIKTKETKYGFYLIELDFDNTINSFNLNTIKRIVNIQSGKVTYDYNANLVNFDYINNYNVVDPTKDDYYDKYAVKLIRQLLPFMKVNLLNLLNNIKGMVNPKMYSIQTRFSKQLVKNEPNGPSEIYLIKEDSSTRISLLRYMDDIVPLIVPSNNVINNQYNLKFKNVMANLLDDGTFNSIGDSVIYKSNININEYHPIQVYTYNNNYNKGNSIPGSPDYNEWLGVKSYNMNIENFSPLEYKHYNTSKIINLPTYFEIQYPTNLTYEKMLEVETDEVVFDLFKKALVKYYQDDNKLKYVFNKYKILYDSKSIGLNFQKTDKIYRLTYKFYLL